MTSLSIPREAWNDINGGVGDIRDALPGTREASKPTPIPPALEPTKTRPPQASLLTARFEDLERHPAFSQRLNPHLLKIGMSRTEYEFQRMRREVG